MRRNLDKAVNLAEVDSLKQFTFSPLSGWSDIPPLPTFPIMFHDVPKLSVYIRDHKLACTVYPTTLNWLSTFKTQKVLSKTLDFHLLSRMRSSSNIEPSKSIGNNPTSSAEGGMPSPTCPGLPLVHIYLWPLVSALYRHLSL